MFSFALMSTQEIAIVLGRYVDSQPPRTKCEQFDTKQNTELQSKSIAEKPAQNLPP